MDSKTDDLKNRIIRQLTEDQAEVRQRYLQSFGRAVGQFATEMAAGIAAWETWRDTESTSERERFCQRLMLAAISLQMSSMQLFLSGHMSAAGCVQRQVLEAIALAYLCANQKLHVYEEFTKGSYSPQKACRDLVRHGRSLSVESEALKWMKSATSHYNNFSHTSLLTLASQVQPHSGAVYIGGSFDGANLAMYESEVSIRQGVAAQLRNIMLGITHWLDG